MNIGLIGCGDIANRYYGPSLQKLQEEGVISAWYCCDIDSKKAQDFCSKFHCTAYYFDAETMIQHEALSALVLATPIQFTTNLAIQLSKHSIPMLIEKPPALTVDSGEKLVRALKDNGVLHQVAFNRHFMPIVQTLRSELESKYRNIQCIHSSMARYRRIEDSFFVTAIHSIDLVRYLARSLYKTVQLSYQYLPSYGKGVKNIFLSYEFENGISGQMCFLVCSGMVHERLMVTCDDVTYFARLPMWDCDDVPGSLQCYENGCQSYLKSGSEFDGVEDYIINGFHHELESFLNAVSKGIQPKETMEYALESVKIAELINQGKTTYRKENR